METIIAGRFNTWEQANITTLAVLNITGILRGDICTFYVGPPGQHAAYPVGGDQHSDPDANEAHNKSMTGSAIGAGVGGLASLPAGPAAAATGALVGAYAGSLVGSLQGMLKPEEHSTQTENPSRASGVMVAIRIRESFGAESSLIHTLERHGAEDIEKTEGEWRDGEWLDFDPVKPPHLLPGSIKPARS
ncbi:MAG: hypothetical protein ACYCY1_09460 [Sulfuriferula sp.]